MTDFEIVELAIRRVVGKTDLAEGRRTESELYVRNVLHDIADELMKISNERAKITKSGGCYEGSGD